MPFPGFIWPPVSTACLSLSDPGPESQRSPQWKRQWTQRRTGAVCVCVCVCVCVRVCACTHALGHTQLLVTSWTVSRQVPLSMEFSSRETGVGSHSLPCGIFPAQGWVARLLRLLRWQAGSLPAGPLGRPLGGSLSWQHVSRPWRLALLPPLIQPPQAGGGTPAPLAS